MYWEKLNEVSKIDKSSFKKANKEFSEIINNFIDDLNIVERNKYRIKPSIGMGTMSKLWWCTIMDRNFYKTSYGIKDDRSLSADKGYYIAYLFSEDRRKVVLCISQPSKDITLQKNLYKFSFYQKKNELIYNELLNDVKFLRLPKPILSDNNLQNARDFEASMIIFKKYNLDNIISDNEIKNDLIEFLIIYERLIDYITITKSVTIDSIKMSLFTNKLSNDEDKIDYNELIDEDKSQIDLINSNRYTTFSEIETANNSKVEYSEQNGIYKYKRDNRILKTVIEDSNYQCSYNSNHQTFLTKNGCKFVEGHHLVPLKFQSEFEGFRLDRYENIVSLCPICHSAIHYGDDKTKRIILEVLYSSSEMKEKLKNYEINSFNEFYDKFYF